MILIEVEDGSKCKNLGTTRMQAVGRESAPAWPGQWKGQAQFLCKTKAASSPFLPKCWAVFSFSVVFRQNEKSQHLSLIALLEFPV